MRLNRKLEQILAARVYVIAGVIGLIVQILKYLSLRSDLKEAEKSVGEGVVQLSYRYGWWLTALGLIAMIIAGFITVEQFSPTRAEPAESGISGYKEEP